MSDASHRLGACIASVKTAFKVKVLISSRFRVLAALVL